jgi:hypothetical protein
VVAVPHDVPDPLVAQPGTAIFLAADVLSWAANCLGRDRADGAAVHDAKPGLFLRSSHGRSRRDTEEIVKEHSARVLFAALALSLLAALAASSADARIPEGANAPFTFRAVTARPGVVPYLSHGIGVDPSVFAGHRRDRRFAPRVPLRAGAPAVLAIGNRFSWPTKGTATYHRAARMARGGDPEAQRFVGSQSDINPFDAQ